jgi:hypothetical protein
VPDEVPLRLEPPVELPPDMPAPELVPSAPLPVLLPLAEEPDVPPLPELLVPLPLLPVLLDLLLEDPVLPLPVPDVCPLALLPEPVLLDMPEFWAYARGAAAQTTAEMTIVAIACFMIVSLEN